MLRQLWIYLLPEDLEPFCSTLDEVDPGLVVARGRCFRGPPEQLRGGGAEIEFLPQSAYEQHWCLLHRDFSPDLFLHPGPVEGVQCLDERRSDCLVLSAPQPQRGTLVPARLWTETHFVEGSRRIRKSPQFAEWAGRVFRWVNRRYPATAVPFIRVGPEAERWARSNQGRLQYLHQPVGLEPAAGATPVHEPQRKGS